MFNWPRVCRRSDPIMRAGPRGTAGIDDAVTQQHFWTTGGGPASHSRASTAPAQSLSAASVYRFLEAAALVMSLVCDHGTVDDIGESAFEDSVCFETVVAGFSAVE